MRRFSRLFYVGGEDMASYAEDVIKIAEEQVGYMEKASPKDLDSKTANAGYNNYTKFARDLQKAIGSPFVDGYAWCMSFVTWCFWKAFGAKKAKEMLGGWTAYCPTAVSWFKNMGRWYTTPKVGDLIFFYDSDRDYGHVGLVYNVSGSTVYTIEGNTSSQSGVVPNGGGVYKKYYPIDYYRIAGYGRPKYDEKKVKAKKYSGTFPVVPPILRYGSSGLQVERLQSFLNWYGKYGLDVDGAFGSKTKSAVIDFQKGVFPKNSSEWDGEFGTKSLAKAKKVKK